MQAPHHRKIELQSTADLTYLYSNTAALSRQKLDQHLPSSASNDPSAPDSMKERVKELLDEFVTQTFTSASSSISINGMDLPSSLSPSSLLSPETVEYEPYDTALAARLASLYAQLESLITTVAQLRRDAPKRAAKAYADALANTILAEEEEEEKEENIRVEAPAPPQDVGNSNQDREDVEMAGVAARPDDEESRTGQSVGEEGQGRNVQPPGKPLSGIKPDWRLQVSLGSVNEFERWEDGEMAELYSDALRTLLCLQGEVIEPADPDAGKALATTVGKVERAARAAEVVGGM